MPAYAKSITRWTCSECGARATVEVFNRFNLLVGYRCRRHGAALVKRLNDAAPTAQEGDAHG
jgi:hypothetical protein